VSVSDISSSSFSIPLHNVFDHLDRSSTDELDLTIPMLKKVVSPVAHVDVQSVGVGKLHQIPREVLENPAVTDVTNPLLDSVEHNHGNLRELGYSPKGYNERVTHSSPLGREDLRPNPTVNDVSELLQVGVEHDHVSPRELEESPKGARENVTRPSPDEHDDLHEGSDHSQEYQESVEHPIDILKAPSAAETSIVVDGDILTAQAQESVPLQRQEVHPSKNIQHRLKLWERIRDYDARSVAEVAAATDDFVPVLTRNQKQKLKVQNVLFKQPSKSRARCNNPFFAFILF